MRRPVVLALLAVLVGVAPAAGEGSRASIANGLIAVQGKQGGKTAIYVLNADGSGFHVLSAKGAFSGEPAWSPDGSKLAFSSSRSGEGTLSLYLMKASGGAATRVTFDPGDNHDPGWSPDGRQIVYAGTGINVVFEDGSIARRITAELPLRNPGWSPDRRLIVFASGPNERLTSPEIYSVHANGVSLAQLTNRSGGAAQPAWSPDGRHIVFVGVKSDLYVMNPDGTHQRRLTYTVAPESAPVFSPDGRLILFARGTRRMSLFVMPSAGGKAKLLRSVPGISLDQPDWQRRSG